MKTQIEYQEGRIKYLNDSGKIRIIIGFFLCLIGFHKNTTYQKDGSTSYNYCLRCGG